MPWLLNLVYLAVFAAATPWLAYRRLWLGKRIAGFRVKITGSLPALPVVENRVWFHAVSVGEVLLLTELITRLRQRRPDISVVLTTTTETGFDVARKQYPDLATCYYPFDFSWSCKRAIQRLKPTAIVLAELELWPNFVLAASQAGIPLAVTNGRLSERSFRGYRRLLPLLRPLMRRISVVAAQNEEYAARFRAIGVPADRVVATGSLKFDRARTDRNNAATQELRHTFGIAEDEIVFVAGSTQNPEEDHALATWQELRKSFPKLRLILVPRHKERFDEVARLVEEQGLPLLRRSRLMSEPHPSILNPQSSILLLDTLGELAACWGLADIAFVGGSLTNRGGQNMIEPAAFGATVLFGPNTRNFRDAVDLLLAANAATIVRDRVELSGSVRQLLNDPERRRQMGLRAQAAVATHRGATEKSLELILNCLVNGAANRRHARAA